MIQINLVHFFICLLVEFNSPVVVAELAQTQKQTQEEEKTSNTN
jgi:hypothetical protein